MNYLDHFGFKQEPFSNAPDQRFFYSSEQHSQALLRLRYAIDGNKGLAVLVGGIGAGKTTLARRLLENLPVEDYQSSLLVMVHSGVTQEWILTRIAVQLGVENPATDRLMLLRQLLQRLKEIDAEGRRAVVLIDEAQMLESRELMEEFRGLLNLELPGKKLLNIIFFGLPEVDDCLRLDEPLAQRVAVKCYLRPMTVEMTEAYIKHRLQVAGAERLPFSADCISLIHRYADGVPRLINTLCDNCLFEASLSRQKVVQQDILLQVVSDLGLAGREAVVGPAEEPQDELDEIESLLDNLEMK